jgi:hypothetical protein
LNNKTKNGFIKSDIAADCKVGLITSKLIEAPNEFLGAGAQSQLY